MPGPWDFRIPREEPHARIARALLSSGATVVATHDGGKPGKTISTTYEYDCGCRRTYKVEQLAGIEREFLTPCDEHRNLLTEAPQTGTIGGTLEEQ